MTWIKEEEEQVPDTLERLSEGWRENKEPESRHGDLPLIDVVSSLPRDTFPIKLRAEMAKDEARISSGGGERRKIPTDFEKLLIRVLMAIFPLFIVLVAYVYVTDKDSLESEIKNLYSRIDKLPDENRVKLLIREVRGKERR